MRTPAVAACPCGRPDARGRPLPLAACCGRYLDGPAPAPDAESLMRSRYSAYVLRRDAYLRDTWHPSTRPAGLETDPHLKWLGLEIRACREVDADHAEVTFVARYRNAGKGGRVQERSRFVRELGRWYYLEGDVA